MKQARNAQSRGTGATHHGLITSMAILAAAIWSMVLFSPAQSPTAFVALDVEQPAIAPVVQAAAENPLFIMIPNGVCKDTDRGRNYPVIGTAPKNYQRQGTCAGDLCVLLEQYCANDRVAEEAYHCPAGCKDSRCVR